LYACDDGTPTERNQGAHIVRTHGRYGYAADVSRECLSGGRSGHDHYDNGGRCSIRNAVLQDVFMLSFDYWSRTTSFNMTQMAADEDGFFTYVIAHRDPGVHNWLDTGGRRQTIFGQRWQAFPAKNGSAPPAVTSQLVQWKDLPRPCLQVSVIPMPRADANKSRGEQQGSSAVSLTSKMHPSGMIRSGQEDDAASEGGVAMATPTNLLTISLLLAPARRDAYWRIGFQSAAVTGSVARGGPADTHPLVHMPKGMAKLFSDPKHIWFSRPKPRQASLPRLGSAGSCWVDRPP